MRLARNGVEPGRPLSTVTDGAIRVSTLGSTCGLRYASAFSSVAMTSGCAPPSGMRRPTSARQTWLSSLCTAAVATDERYNGDPARQTDPSATIAATATHPETPDE